MWHAFPIDPVLAIVLAALAGLLVGSWLTVPAHRLPRMMEREWRAQAEQADASDAAPYDLLRPGWHCPGCQASVRGWRALPLVGWLAARGRCRQCAAPIGWRYPAMELATAGLFAACAWRFGATPMALCGMGLAATLLVLAWIDFETSLLPDALTLPLAWAGLLVNLRGDGLAPLPLAVLGAVAGYLFLWVVFHAFRLLTRREGMGYGDFKLMAALGAWFGLAAVPWLLLGASLAGAVVGIGLRLAGRIGRGHALPFGPYLAMGGILMLLAMGEPAWVFWYR
ncbi:prepilin peptidase [Bordetella sp. 2513F-2]